MQMTLYKNTSDNRYLTKSISQVGNIISTLYLKDDTAVVNPIIILDDFPNGVNYCYLDTFDRYYYLTDVTMLNGQIQTTWHVDVLMSFKDDIKTQKVLVKRTRKVDYIDYYLRDDEFLAEEYTCDRYIPFTGGNAFQKDVSNYILAVMGTGGDTPDTGDLNINIVNPANNPVNIGGTIGQYSTQPPTPPTNNNIT